MHSKEFIERMKEKLLEEQERLAEELSNLHEHTEMGDDLDSNAEEVNADEVSQDIEAQLKQDLEKIDAALQRIEKGTYGFTEDGREIPEARLEVLPWAETLAEQ